MTDFFEVLGLPRRFDIDPAELERRYLERSREVHPDREGGSAGDAMTVNQAYRALRRELSRAEHLLVLAGVAIGPNEPVAPELLAEVLELREELAEAQADGQEGRVMELERRARATWRAELGRLAPLFGQIEAGVADGPAAMNQIKQQVIRLRYLARYLEAFEEEDDGAGAHGVIPHGGGAAA